jgi:hypothetical protein
MTCGPFRVQIFIARRGQGGRLETKVPRTAGSGGHHFRLSQWTLAAAGAVARVVPGRRSADESVPALL